MLDEPKSAASPPAALPGLNATSLGALRALDPSGGGAFLRRVLETYLRSMDKHLDALRAARAASDLNGLRAVAHTLKSSSSSIGALAFAASSAELEAALRERIEASAPGVADPLAGLGEQLSRYLAQAQQVREAVLAELGGTAP
ncbi:MAG: Hpt domain-containing protein [Vitreoscilla sp.]|nr:Hpt domain-containing protein [Burkholderiales bacterium]MBP6338510.1 Hpt domain-containing protein [Vitreoscilla sp.]MBP6676657.1 Hpt domain-containing protein [Vitreoscilla sp.]